MQIEQRNWQFLNIHCSPAERPEYIFLKPNFMKSIALIFSIIVASAMGTLSSSAQTNTPNNAPTANADAKQIASLQKHIKPILDALKLRTRQRKRRSAMCWRDF
jgi:hypothetical protein